LNSGTSPLNELKVYILDRIKDLIIRGGKVGVSLACVNRGRVRVRVGGSLACVNRGRVRVRVRVGGSLACVNRHLMMPMTHYHVGLTL
jgi:hypothetical protein